MDISILDHVAIMNAFASDQLPSRISRKVQAISQKDDNGLKDTHFLCVIIDNSILSNDEIKEISKSIRDIYGLESYCYSMQTDQVVDNSTLSQESTFNHETVLTTLIDLQTTEHELEKCNEEMCDVSNYLESSQEDSRITRLESIRNYMLNCINSTTIISVNNFLFYEGLKYLVKVLKDTHVASLDLSNNNISREVTEYLESVLRDDQLSSINVRINTTDCDNFDSLVQCKENTKITTLDLSCNEKVRENCLDFLAPILKDSQIVSLDLSNNLIKCETLKILAECLVDTIVTSLNLSCNFFDSDAISCLALALKNTQINSIDLSYTKMNVESLRILTSSLVDTGITSINLSGNDLDYNAINCLALALPNTQITSIDLSYTTMNCESLKLFVSYLVDTKITSLNLSGNQFGYDGINHLAQVLKNTQITSIDLSRNNINYESFIVLSSCLMDTKISCLSLSGNKLGYDGVNYLSQVLKNTQITSIDLSENYIDCEGLKVLASCLVDTNMSSLDLSSNKLGYYGIKYLASSLRDCNITILNLSNNSLGCNSIKNLVLCLEDTNITTLDVSGNNICCNAFYLASVLKRTRITNLNLSNNKLGNHDPKNLILGLKNTDTSLDLSRENMCSIVLYYLARNLKEAKLIYLNLSCIEIDYGDLKYLSQGLLGSSVVSLDLSNNKINNCNDVHYLAQILRHTRISSLNLSNTEISHNGLKYLVQGLRGSQITSLNLSDNSLEDESFEFLAKNLECTGNIELYLYGIKIAPKLAYELFESIVRRETNVVRIGFDDHAFSVRVNLIRYPGYYHIEINQPLLKNAVDDIKLLNNAYQKSGITKVIFHNVSYDSHSLLAQAFDNVSIREIELKMYYLDTRIATIFKNSKIAELKVNCKDFRVLDESKLDLISLHFQYMTGCTSLDLHTHRYLYSLPHSESHLELPLNPKTPFFNELKNFIINNISYLDLRSINLGDEEFQCLPGVLKDSKIISLNLSNNKIGAKGIEFLAGVLPHTKITYIDLHGNIIGYLGYTYLMNVVSRTNICWLSLGGNNIENLLENDIKLSPYVVSRNDSPISFQIRYLFRELVSLNTSNDKFEFIVPQENSNPSVNLNHYPLLMKTLLETPSYNIHIYDMIYMKSKKHDVNVMNKIDSFVENIKKHFFSFIEERSNLKLLEQLFGYDSFVDLVKACEYLGLDDVVSRVLLDRSLYYVNEENNILHPFIYKMLHKYELPLLNEGIEPNIRENIINYFQNSDIDGAMEVIDILGSEP